MDTPWPFEDEIIDYILDDPIATIEVDVDLNHTPEIGEDEVTNAGGVLSDEDDITNVRHPDTEIVLGVVGATILGVLSVVIILAAFSLLRYKRQNRRRKKLETEPLLEEQRG